MKMCWDLTNLHCGGGKFLNSQLENLPDDDHCRKFCVKLLRLHTQRSQSQKQSLRQATPILQESPDFEYITKNRPLTVSALTLKNQRSFYTKIKAT